MKKIRTLATLLLLFFTALPALAQNGNGALSGFGETMRSNGRIYVVVAVMLTILLGLILYLVRIERKIKKLEEK